MGKKVLAVGIIRNQRVLFPYNKPKRTFTSYTTERGGSRFEGILDHYGMYTLPPEKFDKDNSVPVSQTKEVGNLLRYKVST